MVIHVQVPPDTGMFSEKKPLAAPHEGHGQVYWR